jgi:4-amino-4-deoxy-L-arabinose transferase-like glycosyltransferase
MSKTNILITVSLLFLGIMYIAIYSWNLEEYPMSVHCDEIYPAQHGQDLIRTGRLSNYFKTSWLDAPAITYLPHGLATIIGGNTVFALRFLSVVCSALCVLVVFLIVYENLGLMTAIFTMFFLSTSHWWIAMSRLGLVNIHTVLPEVLTFYFLLLGIKRRSSVFFICAGLCMGFGMYLYMNFRIVPLIIGLLLAIYILSPNRARILNRVTNVFLLLFASILICAPLLSHYIHNPGVIMSQSGHSNIFSSYQDTKLFMQSIYHSNDPMTWLIGNIKKTITILPVQDASPHYGYFGPLLDALSFVLFFIGFSISIRRYKQTIHQLFLLWFIITYVFVGILTTSTPFLARLVGVIPVVNIFIGMGLFHIYTVLKKLFLKHKTSGSPASQLMLYGGIVAIALFICGVNIYTYFVRAKQQRLPLFGLQEGTSIPRFIQNRTKFQIYFVPGPYANIDMCLFKYLNPETLSVSLTPEVEFSLLPKGPKLIFIDHQYNDMVGILRDTYPKGVYEPRKFGSVDLFSIYE